MCGEVSLSSCDPEPFVSVLLDLLLLGLVVPMWCGWIVSHYRLCCRAYFISQFLFQTPVMHFIPKVQPCDIRSSLGRRGGRSVVFNCGVCLCMHSPVKLRVPLG
jgi:hypothetical protein